MRWLRRVAEWILRPAETVEHAYLSRAVDLADLERRMRDLQRGRFNQGIGSPSW